MTKDQAIEKCRKAISRMRGNSEGAWKGDARTKEFAENIVICLRELELLKTH